MFAEVGPSPSAHYSSPGFALRRRDVARAVRTVRTVRAGAPGRANTWTRRAPRQTFTHGGAHETAERPGPRALSVGASRVPHAQAAGRCGDCSARRRRDSRHARCASTAERRRA
eukprot:2920864-Prymnesium_polylepis.1